MARDYHYYGDYPGRARRVRRVETLWSLLLPGLLGGLAGIGVYGWGVVIWFEPGWSGSAQWLVCVAVASLCACGAYRALFGKWRFHVVPYFERSLGLHRDEGHRPLQLGYGAAAVWRQLDGLAHRVGATPLSAFGFEDDLAGEVVTWHDPGRGIATCEALLGDPSFTSPVVEGEASWRVDVEWFLRAFREAQSQGVRFALIVRSSDDWVTGHEFDVRTGSFW